MISGKPPLALDLEWQGDLRFLGRTAHGDLLLDGGGKDAPSPVEGLAFCLAGCMATDTALILTKGRQDLSGLKVRFTGWRADEEPRRFLRIELRFLLRGELEPKKVERALALSREKYCSVWHSMRQDIELSVAYEIEGRR